MSKTDLRARPIFHRTRAAIEAHLTIVFTALAVARAIQDHTDIAIAKLVKQLRPLRTSKLGTLPRRDAERPVGLACGLVDRDER